MTTQIISLEMSFQYEARIFKIEIIREALIPLRVYERGMFGAWCDISERPVGVMLREHYGEMDLELNDLTQTLDEFCKTQKL
jgi:hypothetical protein